jgi:hypothetical protein
MIFIKNGFFEIAQVIEAPEIVKIFLPWRIL